MHTDAVQALGKIAVDFPALNVHAMTLSAHKIYGPRAQARWSSISASRSVPSSTAAGHEQDWVRHRKRAGPSRIRSGVASLRASRMRELSPRLEAMRVRLERGLHELVRSSSGRARRAFPTRRTRFEGIGGETLVIEPTKRLCGRAGRGVLEREPGAFRHVACDGRGSGAGARRRGVSRSRAAIRRHTGDDFLKALGNIVVGCGKPDGDGGLTEGRMKAVRM